MSKRKFLSLKDKIDIIREREVHKISARKLAENYGVGKTQINNIIKNKDTWKQLFEAGANLEQKRKFTKLEGVEIDQVVYNWFSKALSMNIPISGPLIQQKAIEVAENLKHENFKASNGWLHKFCVRHGITFKSICGESANMDPINVETWKIKLISMLQDYSPRDVYNADETGLYYRAMPNRILALKNHKYPHRKTAKQRLTILFCVNMEGEKENPLIIGKCQNPCCFNVSNVKKLPLEWVSNKKSWMNRDIMLKWLHKFNGRMKEQDRNVLLFLDNAMSHANIANIKLENVKIILLPPDTISHCQPLGQGIIHNFKLTYRNYLLRRLLTFTESEKPFKDSERSINLVNVLTWIAAAWDSISPNIITNCFAKAGFILMEQANYSFDEEDDDIPLAQLFPRIHNKIISLEEFASIDEGIPTECPEMDVQRIIAGLQENGDSSESEAEELKNPKTNFSNLSEICEKLRDMQSYFLDNNSELALDIAEMLLKTESEFLKDKLASLKQIVID